MRRIWCTWLATALAFGAGSAMAQEINFRAVVAPRTAGHSTVAPASADPIPITLGRPQAIPASSTPPITETVAPVAFASTEYTNAVLDPTGTRSFRRVVRGQMADTTPAIPIPPPPPFNPGGAPAPAVFPGAGAVGGPRNSREEEYNCGRINNDADQGGFFERTGDKLSRCWTDLSDGVRGVGTGRTTFQSNNCMNYLISPVSNPHYFEDPRALTEFRPVFMWQSTPGSNYIFKGGDNYYLTTQGRLALTESFSIVVHRLGWVWTEVGAPQQGVQSGNGFSELQLGPKFSWTNEAVNRAAAIGLAFELPIGASQVNQDTGNWSLRPYFSLAQNWWKTDYGSFNFLNTTGYALGIDSQRTDMFFSSFHISYDVGNAQKFFPLVEVNWSFYPFNGSARNIGFEGSNLINFGSAGVAGHHELTVAPGARYKFSEHLQFGVAAEFNVLGTQGGRHLDSFRLTVDMILRY